MELSRTLWLPAFVIIREDTSLVFISNRLVVDGHLTTSKSSNGADDLMTIPCSINCDSFHPYFGNMERSACLTVQEPGLQLVHMRLGLSGKGQVANQVTLRGVAMHWLEEIAVSPIMFFFQICFVNSGGFYIHERYIRLFWEFPLQQFRDSPSREMFAATSLS